MTASRPVYDGSHYGCGYDEERTTGIGDEGPLLPEQGCVRSQLEVPEGMRQIRDTTDIRVLPTLFRLSTRIPTPMRAIQSLRRHVNSVWSNGVRQRKLRCKHQVPYIAPLDKRLTDRDLLPSQRRRMYDSLPDFYLVDGKEKALGPATTHVQPYNVSYHWEDLADSQITSSWVKPLRIRPDEIVRVQAGTLKRNAAVRRSGKDVTKSSFSSIADARPVISPSTTKRTAFGHNHVLSTHKMQRSFSFEHVVPCINPSATWEQAKQKVALKPTSMTRIDSGAERITKGRSTRFREKLDHPPRIARTFSEILGHESFIPTALLDSDEYSK